MRLHSLRSRRNKILESQTIDRAHRAQDALGSHVLTKTFNNWESLVLWQKMNFQITFYRRVKDNHSMKSMINQLR